MKKKPQNRGLGRGLSSLMADIEKTPVATPGTKPGEAPAPRHMMPIEKIYANQDQPRQDFDKDELQNLADSISARGIIQPILVRPSDRLDHYQIIAGERRWRAAQIARLHEVPVVIRDMDDQEVMEIAMIENLQRADLNAIEEAMGYRRLMDNYGHTQERLANLLGKSRSHIANLLRLLNLPDGVQAMVRDGRLSGGHARILVGRDDALGLAKQIIAQGLSVRDIEKTVKKQSVKQSLKKAATAKDSDTYALEADLKAHLKMKINIQHHAGGQAGKMVINYDRLDQLDQLCALLLATKPRA